jgi:hypothetical protein
VIGPHTSRPDRARAALTSLSAVGAAVGGFGVGVLFAKPLGAAAWPALIVGLAVHLFGMIGSMRLQATEGYQPSSAERIGYWLCWAIIAALLVYAAIEVIR